MASPLVVAAYSATPWEHACAAYRLVAPARAAGLQLLRGTAWRGRQMEAIDSSIIAQSDLVLIQRDFPFYQSWFEEVVSRASQQHKPIIYEIDDLLFELPADNPYKANFDRARPAMLQGLVESHVVTASTAALCGYLGAFNQNVYRLSNYLDDNLWPLAPRSTQAQVGPITIGYIGGPTHAADIASIAPVLVRLQQRYPGQVRLRFCGIAAPPSLARRSGVDEELLSLQDYSEYAAYMQTLSVDIVVAPLCNHLFNHCKSAAKFLEYSALAFPGVYDSGPTYAEVVEHGHNGLLAGSPEEWEESLCRLIEDRQLRRQIGAAAQETVAQRYRLSQHAGEWANIYQTALDSKWKSLSDSIPARLARQTRLWADEAAAQPIRTAPPPTYWQRLKKQLRRRLARRPGQ